MTGDKLLDLMRLIDTKYVEEAEEITAQKKVIPLKWCIRVACVSITIVVGLYLGTLQKNNLKHNRVANNETAKEKVIQSMTEEKTSFDDTPINYSDLSLARGEDNDITLPNDSIGSDALPFHEELLKELNCCMIIEGTIKDVRLKTYKYDIKSDKFETNGVLHNTLETVIYEIEVSKTWYGDDVSGKTIVIEDENYCTSSMFKLKKGMKFVIPLYVYGEDMLYSKDDDFATGETKRQSKYSTLCPYEPQIVVTEDEGYIVSEHWSTLVMQNARKVVFDQDDESNIPLNMYFVAESTFEKQMDWLINDVLK